MTWSRLKNKLNKSEKEDIKTYEKQRNLVLKPKRKVRTHNRL